MKILLDEQVPLPFRDPLRWIAGGHEVNHVDDLGWKGKPDTYLLRDARARGYHALVTNDRKQLSDPVETAEIKKSGLHHITFTMGNGLDGAALALASLVASVGGVVADLAAADGQRLVRITALARRGRHTMTDPRVTPPPYWR